MMVRSIAVCTLGIPAMLVWMGFPSLSQNRIVRPKPTSNTATHASAELVKGRLNPGRSLPGDQVTLKLTDDVRSNGQVVLRKGTPIPGIVRNVKSVEGQHEAVGQATSMMELEWLVPPALGKVSQQLMIALQYVSQVSAPAETASREEGPQDSGAARSQPASIGPMAKERVNGQSNAALMSMPSVVALDHDTTSTLRDSFGIQASDDQLFKVGRGEVVSAAGLKQSFEIFSHLSNDTVLTSQSKNFEISSGAQLQLLVGVRKN